MGTNFSLELVAGDFVVSKAAEEKTFQCLYIQSGPLQSFCVFLSNIWSVGSTVDCCSSTDKETENKQNSEIFGLKNQVIYELYHYKAILCHSCIHWMVYDDAVIYEI